MEWQHKTTFDDDRVISAFLRCRCFRFSQLLEKSSIDIIEINCKLLDEWGRNSSALDGDCCGVTEQGDILYSTGFVAQHCQCSGHTPLNVKWNLTDILFNISLHLPTSPSMSVFVPSLRGMLLCGFYCLLRPVTAVLSAQTGSLKSSQDPNRIIPHFVDYRQIFPRMSPNHDGVSLRLRGTCSSVGRVF